MRIIEINSLDNGGHRNQTINSVIPLPEGWAIIPDDMEIPDTFPFVDITVEDGIVTEMTAGVVPPPEPEPEPQGDVWDEIANAIRNGVNAVE